MFAKRCAKRRVKTPRAEHKSRIASLRVISLRVEFSKVERLCFKRLLCLNCFTLGNFTSKTLCFKIFRRSYPETTLPERTLPSRYLTSRDFTPQRSCFASEDPNPQINQTIPLNLRGPYPAGYSAASRQLSDSCNMVMAPSSASVQTSIQVYYRLRRTRLICFHRIAYM